MRYVVYLIMSFFWINCSFCQNYQWKNVNLQGMGFVTGIISHPTEKNLVFCRTDVGGIYRWNAFDKNWEPVTDGKIENYNIEEIALDYNDPNLVYLASGGKLYKSINKGTNWEQLVNFPNVFMNGNGQFRFSGKRLMVDPNNNGSDLYFVTRQNGLLQSSDQGNSWKMVSAQKLPFGNNPDNGQYGQTFVAIDKTSGNETARSSVIYAGVHGKGVFKSEDSGENWTLLEGGPDVSYKPVCGTVGSDGAFYITYSTSFNEWELGKGKLYKYTSELGMMDISPVTNNGYGYIGIDVNIHDPNKIIAIQEMFGNDRGIHYSVNGGKSWSPKKVINVLQPAWYPSWTAWTYTGQIMFDPFAENKIWMTTGFGVFLTNDIRSNSPAWYTEMHGLEEFVMGQVQCPPVENGPDLFTLQMDQIAFQIKSRDEVPKSPLFPGGFGIGTGMDYCAADPDVIAVVGSDQNDGGLVPKHRFTTDGGSTWQPFPSIPSKANNGNIAISASDSKNWVWAPRYLNGEKVLPHYTKDGGNTWIQSTGIPALDNGATHYWSINNFLQSDKINGNRFYYYMVQDFQNKGVIYRSDNGGVSFKRVYSGLPSHYNIKLKAMPGKEGTLYFHIDGGGLYRTTNGCNSFERIANIGNVMAFGFGKPILPSNHVTIFLAGEVNNEQGVYRSVNNGVSWDKISASNIPYPLIADVTGDMRYENIVYLATGGRGVIYGYDKSALVIPVTGIGLNEKSINLKRNENFRLHAVVLPTHATNPRYSWKSLNNKVAEVTNGKVTGLQVGKTQIVVTSIDGFYTDTCNVEVSDALSALDFNLSKKMKVYPNPLDLKKNNFLNIETGSSNASDLTLYNISGQLLVHQAIETDQPGNFSYRLPEFIKQGFYLLYITGENGKRQFKLLIR